MNHSDTFPSVTRHASSSQSVTCHATVDAMSHAYQQELERLRALSASRGGLLSSAQAARILGLSKPRITQLVSAGRLEKVRVLDTDYITGGSLEAFAALDRPHGVHLRKLQAA
jgi:hypothetical protein